MPAKRPFPSLVLGSQIEINAHVARSERAVVDWLAASKGDRLQILFSTYQSAHHVAGALSTKKTFAQVMVMDEAHRTAQLRQPKGKRREDNLRRFTLCHEQNEMPARYRLYQTATPRVYGGEQQKRIKRERPQWAVVSMDNQRVFGPIAYRLAYTEAVDKGLLSDYRIIALCADSGAWDEAVKWSRSLEGQTEVSDLTTSDIAKWLAYGAALSGAVRGVETDDGHRALARSLAFHNRVDHSKLMASELNSARGRKAIERYASTVIGKDEIPKHYNIEHLDATHAVKDRRAQLDVLAAGTEKSPCAITNVGIFGEGTDSPNLDAVALLAPRSSPVEIIQIVGRVMRLSPDKSMGYVIVPVLLPRGVDAETSLAQGKLGDEWKPLGKTLHALRAHDGRIEDSISDLLQIYMPPPETEPVDHAVVIRNGPSSEIWTGTWHGKPDHAEDALNRANLPAWDEDARDITDWLTPKKGWNIQRVEEVQIERKDGQKVLSFTGDASRDAKILLVKPFVLVGQRTRREVTTEQLQSETTAGKPDPPRTIEIAQAKAASQDRLSHKPRRRRARSKQKQDGFEQYSLLESEQLEGMKDFRVEVMQKSGLRGDSERDFNLLIEPVEEASQMLRSEGLEKSLRSTLRMEHMQKTDKQADACKIAALLLLNAAMLQARLESARGNAANLIDKNTLDAVNRKPAPLKTLRKAWRGVLGHDYTPVFKPALEIVEAIQESDARMGGHRAVTFIAQWAMQNADTYASMGMDYAGELFSRVIGNQASDGAFFTRQSSARLLAELALDATGETDWRNQSVWQNLKTVDLACGSGTLLNAWLEAIKARINDPERALAFHKYAVERLAVGLDINPISLQLAGCKLTFGNMDVDYRKMRLHAMDHGPVHGEPRLGTPELLTDPDLVQPVGDDAGGFLPCISESSVPPDAVESVQNCRIVIMNPPFTAKEKKGHKFVSDVTRELQDREKAIRNFLRGRDADAGGVINANSISTLFTPLADKVLMADHGVLAKILPVTACVNTSGQRERAFLAKRFHIELIVCCHEPKEMNLSHSDISECLLIATRNHRDEPTRFVNLRDYPKNRSDTESGLSERAVSFARAIREKRFEEIGTVCEWPQDRMRAGDWSPVQWFDPELARAAHSLKEYRTLDELYKIGPGGEAIRATFKRVAEGEAIAGTVPVFDSSSTELRFSLSSEPDAFWRMKPDPSKHSAAKSYLAKRGHVLLAASADTQSARVVSVFHREKHFGNGFIPVLTDTPEQAKALCVLWNSTPILLQLLSKRNRQITYPHWSKPHLASVHLPPTLADDPEMTSDLAEVYDSVCNERLLRWREADTDRVRAEIDRAAAQAYGLDEERVADWRKRLAHEPTITKRKAE